MGVDAATSPEVSRQVLGDLVAHFEVSVGFLRHNDHRIHASGLIAEWPPRPDGEGFGPIELIHFSDADPVFALAETLREPTVIRAETTGYYRRTIEEGSQAPPTTIACVPLLAGEITTGVLGFVKFGIRDWRDAELNALMAIAALFAQVQARVEAEDQLRSLAEHCWHISMRDSSREDRVPLRHCSSTWTGSRRSTTTSATRPAIASSARWPSGWRTQHAGPI
jgi:GAF domain-containing protein